ncbi:ATP-binding protein, partial [Clostridium sp.]
MIKGYQQKITELYEKIQEDEKKALRRRKEEIKLTVPEVMELDNEIQRLSISLPMSILRGIPEEELNAVREKITSLRERKYELLTANGYPMDYLTLHYQCNKCKDTGFIGNKKCSCYKSKLVKLYYQTSELENSLRNCNFKNFNINLFSSTYDNNHKYTQKKNMEMIYEFIIGAYLPNFEKSNTNLLFYGESGTGKT